MFCFVSNLSYTSKSRRFVIVGLVHAMCGSVILEPWFLSLPYIDTEKMKKCASCLAVDTSLCKCLCLAFMSRVFPLSLQLGWRKGTLGMWTLSWQNSHLWLNLQKKKQIRLRPEAPHHWRGRAGPSPPLQPHLSPSHPAEQPTFSWFSFSASNEWAKFLSASVWFWAFVFTALCTWEAFSLAYRIANSFFLGSQLKCHPSRSFITTLARLIFFSYPPSIFILFYVALFIS